jgi:hypothetical protein
MDWTAVKIHGQPVNDGDSFVGAPHGIVPKVETRGGGDPGVVTMSDKTLDDWIAALKGLGVWCCVGIVDGVVTNVEVGRIAADVNVVKKPEGI